jgi:hypothetical protein
MAPRAKKQKKEEETKKKKEDREREAMLRKGEWAKRGLNNSGRSPPREHEKGKTGEGGDSA